MNERFFYRDPASASRLSAYLREGDDDELRRRRGVIALSLTAAGVLGVIGLFQSGIIRKVPDLPVKGFDASRINRSDQAYQVLSTPDAFLGLVSYGVTAALAAMGGPDRARRLPWVPIALAAKATADAAVAAKLSRDQPTRFKAFSAPSLLASLCTFCVLPLVLPDARRAIRVLTSRGPT